MAALSNVLGAHLFCVTTVYFVCAVVGQVREKMGREFLVRVLFPLAVAILVALLLQQPGRTRSRQWVQQGGTQQRQHATQGQRQGQQFKELGQKRRTQMGRPPHVDPAAPEEVWEQQCISTDAATASLPADLSYANHLTVADCPNLVQLPSLTGFPDLHDFSIRNCLQLSSLPDGLRGSVHITGCPQLASLPHGLTLSSLTIIGSGIKGFATFPATHEFRVTDCPDLKDIPEIPSYEGLDTFELVNCPLVTKLPEFPPTLKKLRLVGLSLKQLPKLPPDLTDLSIQDCPLLEVTELLPALPGLKQLVLANVPGWKSAFPTRLPEGLTLLAVGNLGVEVDNFQDWPKNLRTLTLVGASGIPLNGLPQSVDLLEIRNRDDQASLVIPPSVMELKITECGVAKLDVGGLIRLKVKDCRCITEIKVRPRGSWAASVDVFRCSSLKKVDCSETQLFSLHMEECPALEGLNLPSSSVPHVKIQNCGRVANLRQNDQLLTASE